MSVGQFDSLETVLGAKRAGVFAEQIGVRTVGGLLRYVPHRYVRQGQLSAQRAPEVGEHVTLVARVVKADLRQMRNRKGKLLSIKANDGTRNFSVTFFNPYGIARVLTTGVRFMVSGEVGYFRDEMQLTHPDWMVLPEPGSGVEMVGSAMLTAMAAGSADAAEIGSDSGAQESDRLDSSEFLRPFLPVYPATRALQTWDIWTAVRQVLAQVDTIADPLDPAQREARGLIGADEALRLIHLPDTAEHIESATQRLKFDEALALQVGLAQRRSADRGHRAPVIERVADGIEDAMIAQLPFTLTAGQSAVIQEICADLSLGEPMNRLLQGEVGSGKTLAALLCMLRLVDNGYQCALLAPTEVLAVQHHRTLRSMLGLLACAGELGAPERATRVALLTGSMKTAAKRDTLLEVVTGTAGILIGTHALLEDHVEFFDLGLIVVDEQHRFGVEQRDTLRNKGRDGLIPHMLVMTATPIPRTVAMTVYGDLETSTLRELPAGRAPISTNVVFARKEKWERRLWEIVDEQVMAGHQVYVVCPRIGDDEPEAQPPSGPPMTSALQMLDQLTGATVGRHRIDLLHGRLPAEDKAAVMDAFTRGEIDILVSTTVVEVGVDVHNATTMVIVDAERFGVSQLHQLRGRVGRGGLPGICFLRTSLAEGSPSIARLQAVAGTIDGFELARIDLMQRREGDVLGAAQSGMTTSLRFLSLLDDAEIITDARALATSIVAADPTLAEHPALIELVEAMLGTTRAQYLEKS
ncbi:ATP-dependent DNA helicase RecG [Williamsia sp. CHRR-6]|uniref:ATP-dependent DNA helicase RecG n=1 Tax=Williamsia sp. CHRR-6 TaxID=2835871 RepID=UPI001BD98825|nr:ATP-dependent DNA helicase RecG [Williamsia sp. CHRR-6]MBT0565421.1 ATP-dependent DNA helicase RecG [Williamsia sp. CHRR-6]